MNKLPSITNAFKTLVEATEAAIIADATIDWGELPKKLYFMHGHPKEIVQRLADLGKGSETKDKKYPLVALFRDIKEKITQGAQGLNSKFKVHLVICVFTEAKYRADEREEKNFIPILHPIVEHLIQQLTESSEFGCPSIDELELEKWDRYFWGTQSMDAQILLDRVDAVEIENITLSQSYFCVPTRINN